MISVTVVRRGQELTGTEPQAEHAPCCWDTIETRRGSDRGRVGASWAA